MMVQNIRECAGSNRSNVRYAAHSFFLCIVLVLPDDLVLNVEIFEHFVSLVSSVTQFATYNFVLFRLYCWFAGVNVLTYPWRRVLLVSHPHTHTHNPIQSLKILCTISTRIHPPGTPFLSIPSDRHRHGHHDHRCCRATITGTRAADSVGAVCTTCTAVPIAEIPQPVSRTAVIQQSILVRRQQQWDSRDSCGPCTAAAAYAAGAISTRATVHTSSVLRFSDPENDASTVCALTEWYRIE
jgi:hypothetical protein